MNAFVLNRHGRMVCSSSITPERGSPSMETSEQLDDLLSIHPT